MVKARASGECGVGKVADPLRGMRAEMIAMAFHQAMQGVGRLCREEAQWPRQDQVIR